MSRSNATATAGSTTDRSITISMIRITTASAMTTGQIFALPSLVKSPSAPPVPPTAVSVPVALAKRAAHGDQVRAEVPRPRRRGRLLRDDHDHPGGAAAVEVHHRRGLVAARRGRAGDGGEDEVAGAEQPGRGRLQLLDVLRRRQLAAELGDRDLHLVEAADERVDLAGGRPESGRELAVAARELVQPALELPGACGQLLQP